MNPDILIIGAGPGGSTAAALLARQGWNVLLVDRALFPRPKTCGDGLSPRAIVLLERLDSGLLQSDFQRVHEGRLIAPDGAKLDVSFAEAFQGLPPVALVIPRLTLDDMLRRHAERSGACLWQGAAVTETVVEGDHIARLRIRGENEIQEVSARLVIVATGASLRLLKQLGVLRRTPTVMRAARAYYEGVEGLDGRMEFFFPEDLLPGYTWAFPVEPGRANVGVALAPGSRLRNSSASVILRHLESKGDGLPWLASARRVGPVQGYPIRTDFPSHRVHGANWLLIGESAGLVNPITGEGIDLAMESGALAAEFASAALRDDDASGRMLRRYERELRRRYAGYFRDARLLQRVILRPWLVNRLIRQGRRHRDLAVTIATVALGVASPWLFATPRVWWRILR